MPTGRSSTQYRPQATASPQEAPKPSALGVNGAEMPEIPEWLTAFLQAITGYLPQQAGRAFDWGAYFREVLTQGNGASPNLGPAVPGQGPNRRATGGQTGGIGAGMPYSQGLTPGQGTGPNRVATGGMTPGVPLRGGVGSSDGTQYPMPTQSKPLTPMTMADLAIVYLGEYNRLEQRKAKLEAIGVDNMSPEEEAEYSDIVGGTNAFGQNIPGRLANTLQNLEGAADTLYKMGDTAQLRRVSEAQANAALQAQQFNMDMASANFGQNRDQFAASHGLNVQQMQEGARQFDATQTQALKTLGLSQDFTRDENAANRQGQIDLAAKNNGFQTTEREATQRYGTGEREATQTYQSGEAKAGRVFTAEQQRAQNTYNAEQARIEREFKRQEAQILSAYEKGSLDEARATREMNNAYNQQKMSLDKANSEYNNMMRGKEFGLSSQSAVGTQMGNAARLGEDARQFGITRQDTQRQNAMDAINKYVEQGYNIGTTPEYTTGGAPGGSVSQIMEAFGGPKANPMGYLKPMAPLTQMQPAINTYMGTPQGPAPAPTNPSLDAFNEFVKRMSGQYGNMGGV